MEKKALPSSQLGKTIVDRKTPLGKEHLFQTTGRTRWIEKDPSGQADEAVEQKTLPPSNWKNPLGKKKSLSTKWEKL